MSDVESYLVFLAAEIVQSFANQSTPHSFRVAVLHLPYSKNKFQKWQGIC